MSSKKAVAHKIRNALFKGQAGKCAACGVAMLRKGRQSDLDYTVHHIKPLCLGVNWMPDNIVGLCRYCHAELEGDHGKEKAAHMRRVLTVKLGRRCWYPRPVTKRPHLQTHIPGVLNQGRKKKAVNAEQPPPVVSVRPKAKPRGYRWSRPAKKKTGAGITDRAK